MIRQYLLTDLVRFSFAREFSGNCLTPLIVRFSGPYLEKSRLWVLTAVLIRLAMKSVVPWRYANVSWRKCNVVVSRLR